MVCEHVAFFSSVGDESCPLSQGSSRSTLSSSSRKEQNHNIGIEEPLTRLSFFILAKHVMGWLPLDDWMLYSAASVESPTSTVSARLGGVCFKVENMHLLCWVVV